MGYKKKLLLIFLITLVLLIFISCESISQELDRIEKEYSKEVRDEIEAIEDLEKLEELLNNEAEIEKIHNRFKRLDEIEKEYSFPFREVLEDIKDYEYLDEVISDTETIKLLNDVFVWKKEWTSQILNFRYENDEINLIIKTVEHMRFDDNRRVAYLEFLKNKTSLHLSLQEISEVFKKSYDAEYPIDKIYVLFDEIEEYGFPFGLKMSEIQDEYGLDFYEYLKTFDDEYLINIITNDVEIEEYYKSYLSDKMKTFYEENVVFVEEVKKEFFPSSFWDYDKEPVIKVLSGANLEKAMRIVYRALDKYPPAVIIKNLDNIYVVEYLEYGGVAVDGVASGRNFYVAINPDLPENWLWIAERVFHHEFSHVLHKNYYEYFNEIEWVRINPDNFNYLNISGHEYNANQAEYSEGKSFHDCRTNGFWSEYSTVNIKEDFATIAENMFVYEEIYINDKNLLDAIEEYPKIRQKFELAVDFYHLIDPVFTEEYFREISGQAD